MKTKASWKPIGHSANKWREAMHRRKLVLKTAKTGGPRRKNRNRNPLAA